jgi:hypothetical protein
MMNVLLLKPDGHASPEVTAYVNELIVTHGLRVVALLHATVTRSTNTMSWMSGPNSIQGNIPSRVS